MIQDRMLTVGLLEGACLAACQLAQRAQQRKVQAQVRRTRRSLLKSSHLLHTAVQSLQRLDPLARQCQQLRLVEGGQHLATNFAYMHWAQY